MKVFYTHYYNKETDRFLGTAFYGDCTKSPINSNPDAHAVAFPYPMQLRGKITKAIQNYEH